MFTALLYLFLKLFSTNRWDCSEISFQKEHLTTRSFSNRFINRKSLPCISESLFSWSLWPSFAVSLFVQARVPEELLITYRFLAENDERGRGGIKGNHKVERLPSLFISNLLSESSCRTPDYISFSCRKRRAWKVTIPRIVTLTHAPLHLIGNESVEFDCVFHWEFFGEGFDKAHDDHFCGFLFGEAAAHEVVELFFGDFWYLGFVF